MNTGVVIVGGSLTGLTFAMACAQRGIPSIVLERKADWRNGAALGIDRSLLMRVVGTDAGEKDQVVSFPVTTVYRSALTWSALHDWLRNQTKRWPEISLVEGREVIGVMDGDDLASAVTANGESVAAQVIVGADGYRSIVREAVSPLQPEATYAGYVLWRGLVPEADLPTQLSLPQSNDGIALSNDAGFRLVAYPVAGRGGALRTGERLLSFAWYDASRNALLQELGCLTSSGRVLGSLNSEAIPARVLDELANLASRIWPEPWRSVVIHALERQQVFATPVCEYLPLRLQRGRFAVIGDAAHVVSPKTGGGFISGILDAEALAVCLAQARDGGKGDLSAGLTYYEERRLADAQTLVRDSIAWSRAFIGKSIRNSRRKPSDVDSDQEFDHFRGT